MVGDARGDPQARASSGRLSRAAHRFECHKADRFSGPKYGPLLGAENTDRFWVPKRGPSFRAVVRTELHPRSTECFRPALYVCMPWRPTCGAWRAPRGPTRCAFRHPKSVRFSAPKIGPYFGPEIRSAFRNRKSVRFSTKNIGPQLRSTRHTLASRLGGVLCVARSSPTRGLSHPL